MTVSRLKYCAHLHPEVMSNTPALHCWVTQGVSSIWRGNVTKALLVTPGTGPRRIVMLHSFIKKSDKTPSHEREIAEARLKEVKHGYA